MNRPRFTVRTLMASVAVAALLLAGSLMTAKYVRQRRLLAALDYTVRFHRQQGLGTITQAVDKRTFKLATADELSRLNLAWKAHHEALRRKYEFALAHPTAPIRPDPPHPVFDDRPELAIDVNYFDSVTTKTYLPSPKRIPTGSAAPRPRGG